MIYLEVKNSGCTVDHPNGDNLAFGLWHRALLHQTLQHIKEPNNKLDRVR
jgi:hypothetical protein